MSSATDALQNQILALKSRIAQLLETISAQAALIANLQQQIAAPPGEDPAVAAAAASLAATNAEIDAAIGGGG